MILENYKKENYLTSFMPIKIISSKDAKSRKISDSYSVINFLTGEDSDKLSVAVSFAENHEETTKTTSERAYFVLEGELIVNNLVAKKGDVIFVPANTEYSFKGSFKAVLINSPPFKKSNESITEIKK